MSVNKDITYISQQAQSICFDSSGKINTLCVGIQGAKTADNNDGTMKVHKLSWSKTAAAE